MLIAVVTGGLAAGKSTVTACLCARGVTVVDADAVAREVVAVLPVIVEIAEAFGPGVITPDGSVDRRALAGAAFADDDARLRLEAITHPRIRTRIADLLAKAAAAGEGLAVVDVPLFVETGGRAGRFGHGIDQVVTVSAPEALRRHRAEGRGMDPNDVTRRLAAQVSDHEREAVADVVLDGSGSPEDLVTQVDAWLAGIVPQPWSSHDE
ncbi:MAG: dephospho-CoA kinase [Bifidobacteriaceae bacterium]|nr:dephospho-CoA kinase [Bifidobacteriaceae bacterium]